MSADPYQPPSSFLGTDNTDKNSKRHSIVANILKWLAWVTTAIFVLMVFVFAYRIDPEKPHWTLNPTGIVILVTLLPLSLFVGLFLLQKIASLWANLVIYGFGLFTTFLLVSCGFFAVLSGDYTLILAGVVALFLYCPLIGKSFAERSPE